MKTLLQYLGNLKEYLVFSLLVLISLILVFQNDNVQIRFIRVFAVSSIGALQSTFSVIPNVFKLEQENRSLREENITLSNELSQFKESKLENLRLMHLLEFKQKTNLRVVSGKVVGKTLIQTRNNITLNIGEKDAVKAGMPVITDKGIVGKIIATSSSFSIAQILLNKDLKVSAKDQRSRVDGIIAWEGGNEVLMKNVSKSADVMAGDIIITSEYSNVFPPGIPVGYVVSVSSADNLFKDIKVEPFVSFVVLEEVFVLKQVSSEERKDLEKIFMERIK